MLPSGYEKKNFYRFDVEIDSAKLLAEYESIDSDAWATSYWGDVHCSVGMLLLRGGSSGTQDDFTCDRVTDSPLLQQLPYIRSLMGADGPFGAAQYAFLFNMEPNGVSGGHTDDDPVWNDMYRIHVPIVTNEDAYLIADSRSMHFAVGHAWVFDNQSRHGVVNGKTERVHLIFDVPYNDVIAGEIDSATYLPGAVHQDHIKTINSHQKGRQSYPGDTFVKEAVRHLRTHGLDNNKIATVLNEKGIPTKVYEGTEWNAAMVSGLLPEKSLRSFFSKMLLGRK